MSGADHVLKFHVRAVASSAKATLRADVQRSVRRSSRKLSVLGRCDPVAALLIERNIDDWLQPYSHGDDQPCRDVRTAEACHALDSVSTQTAMLTAAVTDRGGCRRSR